MSDPVARLNAALEGRYAIECEPGEGGMARRVRAIYGKSLNKWGLLVPPPPPRRRDRRAADGEKAHLVTRSRTSCL